MQQFQNSEIYKKALKEYQEKVFGEILKPIHSIIINHDEVYLFYKKEIIDDLYSQMIKIYRDEIDSFPISLGYQEPEIKAIKFMGNDYKAILLWYDNEEVPKCFQAKI